MVIPFSIIGVLFAIFKEKAAKFVSGFNSLSKEEQALDDYEEFEEFMLEFVAPQAAIEINNHADHMEKSNVQTFQGMLDRENWVLELIIEELSNIRRFQMEVRKADKYDYLYIYRFLSNNYDCKTYFNWDIGRLCFTRYAVNNGINSRSYDEWINNMYLWIQDDEIVGMVHTEEPGDYFIQVAPKYKNYEKEMMKHIMCDVRSKTPERKSIVLTANERDIQRIELLESLGGKKLNDVDILRILNADEYELIDKRSEYEVSAIDKMDDELCQKISDIYRYVWPESRYVPNGEVVKKLLENSDGFETLSWLVRKENEIVAYTMGFVDSNCKYIHLYPIALCQEFLQTQALDTMLDEITRDIKKRKIRYSVISAWYKPEEN